MRVSRHQFAFGNDGNGVTTRNHLGLAWDIVFSLGLAHIRGKFATRVFVDHFFKSAGKDSYLALFIGSTNTVV